MSKRKQLRKIHAVINDQYHILGELCRNTLNCLDADAETVERANDALQDLANALICIGDLVYMDWPEEEATM